MAEFMLFVRLGDYPERSPEEMQRIVQKYSEWSRKLKAGGNLKAGDEFESTGRILTKKQGKIVDGPFTETKESVGGYFLIEADSYDHVVALTQDCPTFDHGGIVEIRARDSIASTGRPTPQNHFPHNVIPAQAGIQGIFSSSCSDSAEGGESIFVFVEGRPDTTLYSVPPATIIALDISRKTTILSKYTDTLALLNL